MSLPNFQKMMYPVLKIAASVKEFKPNEIEQEVADFLNLSKEDRQILLPSETETVLKNRATWATYYLFQAGLLERVKRGCYRITKQGEKELEEVNEISVDYLKKYPSFVNFKNKKHTKNLNEMEETEVVEDVDPENRMQKAFEEINDKLKSDLLDTLRQVNPYGFERVVSDLFERMGYGEAHITPKSHDGAIDGIVDQDELGLDKIYIQAKRYAETNKVHEKEMRDFIGALASSTVHKGVFITTSSFDRKALDIANKVQGKTIRTIDGNELAKLCIKHNIGAKNRRTPYEIKEIDNDYLTEFMDENNDDK